MRLILYWRVEGSLEIGRTSAFGRKEEAAEAAEKRRQKTMIKEAMLV